MLFAMKALALLFSTSLCASAATLLPQWQIADEQLTQYFRTETRSISQQCLSEIRTREDWEQNAPKYRGQLAEMLGLSPMPARGDLQATITGHIDHDEFTVEKVHFQSLPHLYVTANLY